MKNRLDYEILKRFRGKLSNLNYYLAGFADGESTFSVAILKTDSQKFGWALDPCFQVYQHEKQRYILDIFKNVFQAGSVYRKSGVHPVLNFCIQSRRSVIEKVLPFFDKYPLVTKKDSYKKFREIVMAMERGEHLTREGFERLVRIAYSMNQKGKGRRRTMEEILSSLKD